jgi:hypothetical protein
MSRSIIKLFYLSDDNLTGKLSYFLLTRQPFKFQVSTQAAIMQPDHLKITSSTCLKEYEPSKFQVHLSS